MDLSVESRDLAKQIRDAMGSGDEVGELRLIKAFVRSLTVEQREELLKLIEAIKDDD